MGQWIGGSLAPAGGQVSLGEFTTTDDLLQSAERLVPILTIGLHEVVRQASHSCAERGAVLEKVRAALAVHIILEVSH